MFKDHVICIPLFQLLESLGFIFSIEIFANGDPFFSSVLSIPNLKGMNCEQQLMEKKCFSSKIHSSAVLKLLNINGLATTPETLIHFFLCFGQNITDLMFPTMRELLDI